MTCTAIQQHLHFTNALQASGVKAFSCIESGTHFICRGPITYIARPELITNLRHIRPATVCILNADSDINASLKHAGFRKVMTPASVAEIDLTNPPQMLGKWRNALRKAERSPIKTTHKPFHPNRDRWLFAADAAQQRAKKFRTMPHIIVQNWPSRDTILSIATHKGDVIAAMLFLIHGSTATYQIGWANAKGRDFCAHQRLLTEASVHLKSRAVQRLDLGTIDTVNTPGLARFKIGAGATVRPLGGTWAALPLRLR